MKPFPDENMPMTAKEDMLSNFDDEFSPFVKIGKRLGAAALDVVLEELGGLKPHVPTRESFWLKLERELRDRRIFVLFRGDNYPELALLFEMSEKQVRNIVKKMAEVKRTTGRAKNAKSGQL